MKTLNQKEWIAVFVAIFVVGFFFVFGQGLVSIFKDNKLSQSLPAIVSEDDVIGGGGFAASGNRITIHYVGRFVDGRIFDSSIARGEPFQFVLGAGRIIKGLDQGIVGMRVGGRRVISVPPELGYGNVDYGPIPANSTLIFEIQLLKVE